MSRMNGLHSMPTNNVIRWLVSLLVKRVVLSLLLQCTSLCMGQIFSSGDGSRQQEVFFCISCMLMRVLPIVRVNLRTYKGTRTLARA